MTLTLAMDAAFPPGQVYPNAGAVLGYIGGNTPHIWTPDEWRRFQDRAQFPIWVGYQESDPVGHAREAAAAMLRLGWTPNLTNNRRLCLLDFETQISASWVNSFADTLFTEGYETAVYGSIAFVFRNPLRSGYWVADYTERPHIPAGAGVLGCQYIANVPYDGTEVDLSVLLPAMIDHAGTGPRNG